MPLLWAGMTPPQLALWAPVFSLHQFNLCYSVFPMEGCRGINKPILITEPGILAILFAVQMENLTGWNCPSHHKFCCQLMKAPECTSATAGGTMSKPRIKHYKLFLCSSCSKSFCTQRTQSWAGCFYSWGCSGWQAKHSGCDTVWVM